MVILIAIAVLILSACGPTHRVPTSPAVSPETEIEVVVSFMQQQYSAQIAAGIPLVVEDTLSVTELHDAQSYSEFTRSLLA